MSIDSYTKFFIATFILSAIPGPTISLIVHYALMYGRRAGRYTIPATIIGDAIAIFLAFSSIGAILNLFPAAFGTFKIGGGVYLIVLGIFSFFSKEKYITKDLGPSKPRIRSVFVHVMLVTAFNPKSIIFFLAFFPQFLSTDQNTAKQLVILGSTFIGLGAAYAVFYDVLANKIQKWLERKSFQHRIHQVSAIVLIGLGIATIFF